MYVWEPHKDNERLPNSQAIEAYMPFWAKKKGVGIWGYSGEGDNSQKDSKSKYLVNKCLLCHAEAMGHKEDVEQTDPARLP